MYLLFTSTMKRWCVYKNVMYNSFIWGKKRSFIKWSNFIERNKSTVFSAISIALLSPSAIRATLQSSITTNQKSSSAIKWKKSSLLLKHQLKHLDWVELPTFLWERIGRRWNRRLCGRDCPWSLRKDRNWQQSYLRRNSPKWWSIQIRINFGQTAATEMVQINWE